MPVVYLDTCDPVSRDPAGYEEGALVQALDRLGVPSGEPFRVSLESLECIDLDPSVDADTRAALWRALWPDQVAPQELSREEMEAQAAEYRRYEARRERHGPPTTEWTPVLRQPQAGAAASSSSSAAVWDMEPLVVPFAKGWNATLQEYMRQRNLANVEVSILTSEEEELPLRLEGTAVLGELDWPKCGALPKEKFPLTIRPRAGRGQLDLAGGAAGASAPGPSRLSALHELDAAEPAEEEVDYGAGSEAAARATLTIPTFDIS